MLQWKLLSRRIPLVFLHCECSFRGKKYKMKQPGHHILYVSGGTVSRIHDKPGYAKELVVPLLDKQDS
jgi:hypothetical protein